MMLISANSLSSSQKLTNALNIPKNIQSPCHHPTKRLPSPKSRLYDMLGRFHASAESEGAERVRAEIRDYLAVEYVASMTGADGKPNSYALKRQKINFLNIQKLF